MVVFSFIMWLDCEVLDEADTPSEAKHKAELEVYKNMNSYLLPKTFRITTVDRPLGYVAQKLEKWHEDRVRKLKAIRRWEIINQKSYDRG